jgi:hypothetical protein
LRGFDWPGAAFRRATERVLFRVAAMFNYSIERCSMAVGREL